MPAARLLPGMAGAEETFHGKAHSVNVTMNATHDPQRQSWVPSANRPGRHSRSKTCPSACLQGGSGPSDRRCHRRPDSGPPRLPWTVGALPAARGGLCRQHAQSVDGARQGVLVCSARPAQRSAACRSSSGCRSPAGTGATSVADGGRHHAQAGRDRRLHRLLCLD